MLHMLDFYVADVIFRWCMDRSMRDVPSDVRWIFSVHLILHRPWLKPRRQRCAQGQISHLQARHQLKLLYPLKPWRRRPQTATTPPDEATPRLLATAVWPMTDVPHQGGPRVQATGHPSLVTHALTPVPHRWRMFADASPSWVTHDCWRQSPPFNSSARTLPLASALDHLHCISGTSICSNNRHRLCSKNNTGIHSTLGTNE